MFDQIVLWLEQYPYLGVAAVFLLCGMGLPLPEELVLLAAGYVCAKLELNLGVMMVWCGGAIVVGDLLPFVLGRVFGTRLLRVRWMRMLVTKRRLATFDRWFRRRGDMVVLIARFVAGLRVVAFFTAGVMKMPWRRFLFYDGIGIVLIVPLLTWLGFTGQEFIDKMVENVKQVERGILWTALGGGAVLVAWVWWWRRRRRIAARRRVGEAFVQPSRPVVKESDGPTGGSAGDGDGAATEPPNDPPAGPQPDVSPEVPPAAQPAADGPAADGGEPERPAPQPGPEPADDPAPPPPSAKGSAS